MHPRITIHILGGSRSPFKASYARDKLGLLHVCGNSGSHDIFEIDTERRGSIRGAWRMQTSWWQVGARRRTSSSCWQATRTGRPGSCSARSRAATGGSWQLPPTSSCPPCEVCPHAMRRRAGTQRHAAAVCIGLPCICARHAVAVWLGLACTFAVLAPHIARTWTTRLREEDCEACLLCMPMRCGLLYPAMFCLQMSLQKHALQALGVQRAPHTAGLLCFPA